MLNLDSSCSNQQHAVLIRVQPREGNLDRGRKFPIVELSDEQWSSRIDAKLSGRKWIGVDHRGEVFRICDLKT